MSSPISKRRPGATGKARTLRRNETEAEYRLWGHLRNRLLNGYKFARQVPLGSLVIELDGSQHAESTHDLIRTRWLNANGYAVLRFRNHEVLQERRAVLDTIVAALDGRLATNVDNPQFYPARTPSPTMKENCP